MENNFFKYPLYKDCKNCIKDKDLYVHNFIDNFLIKTNEMFTYKNLPETIPQEMLERLLQTNGHLFITEVNGKLYALWGTRGGQLDEYYQPTIYTVANPYLKVNKTFNINTEGVLLRNDVMCLGLLPVIKKYAAVMCDTEISINSLAVLMRANYVIAAPDNKSKSSAEMFMEKLEKGDISVIGDTQFFDGIKTHTLNSNNSQALLQLVQLLQYYKASSLNDIGLNANFNMKKERITPQEYLFSSDALQPLTENMLNCRKKAVKDINEKYHTNIEVYLNSVWELNQEELEASTSITNQSNETDSNTEKNEPVTDKDTKTSENINKPGTMEETEETEKKDPEEKEE